MLASEMATAFFEQMLAQTIVYHLLSNEPFTVDDVLIESLG